MAAVAYAVVLWIRPHWWLYALPALLPVLNLYPWTGWLFIEEVDLLILTTLAVGYWRASPEAPLTRVSASGGIAIALLAASYIISAALPLRDTAEISWSALVTYNTPLNSLRVLKGFAWPLLLLPLLTRASDATGSGFGQVVARGVLAGLVLASATLLWERNAFPGVLDFASDYRAIGSFFEVHVGGAAIDGYLALSLPFAIAALIAARTAPAVLVCAAILFLGTYAAFATFSRGLYAAIAIAVAILGAGAVLQSSGADNKFRLVAVLAALGVCAAVLSQTFATGGYRTLGAVLGAFAAAFYVGGSTKKWKWVIALGIAAAGCLATLAFMLFVPKGAYFAYAVSACAAATLICLERMGHLRKSELVAAACIWLAINSIAVGWHWGGRNAVQDAAIAATVAAALALYNRTTTAPLWTLSWRMTGAAVACGLLMAVAIPVAGNFYMKSRAETVGKDLELRERHWQGTIDMRGGDWSQIFFGAGLGRYPEIYFWNNRQSEFPGSLTLHVEDGRAFARLGGPRTSIGYGEMLRLAQRITFAPGDKLVFRATFRSNVREARLAVSVCEKWMIYPNPSGCRYPSPPALQSGAEWATYSAAIDVGDLRESHWWGTRPTDLIMGVEHQGGIVEIDSVSLTDATGRELLANGAFSAGGDHWHFTSDRDHLPWHAKNLWLGLWFDQGWSGVLAFFALLAASTAGALRLLRARDVFGLALTASIVAFHVVGLFDTLLDAPRVAGLYYLLCMTGLARPAPVRNEQPRRRHRHGHRRHSKAQ